MHILKLDFSRPRASQKHLRLLAAMSFVMVATTAPVTATKLPKIADLKITSLQKHGSFSKGVSTFSGSNDSQRTYFQTTNFTQYLSDGAALTIDATATIPKGANHSGIVFYGLGSGKANAQFYHEPKSNTNIYARVGPSSFANGFFSVTDQKTENIGIAAKAGGDGTHRLRMYWDPSQERLTFAIHKNYSGGDFVATTTIEVAPQTDEFLSGSPELFWGGAKGVVFKDFAVSLGGTLKIPINIPVKMSLK